MKIFLIRHGESMQNTKENEKLKLPDHKVYLTEKGKEEAKEAGLFLKEYIEENNIDITNATIWNSPYERTRETAKIINEILGIENQKEDITLIEQRYGLFSDNSIETLKNKYPEEFQHYDNYYQNEGKFYAKMPQGESPYDVALRMKQFIETLYRDYAEGKDTFFIVSHGTTIRCFVLDWFHHSPEWFANEPNMENCSIRLITKEDKKSTEEYIYKGPRIRKK